MVIYDLFSPVFLVLWMTNNRGGLKMLRDSEYRVLDAEEMLNILAIFEP